MPVRVQENDFAPDQEVAALIGERRDVGAVVTFTGLVRGEAHGRTISGMVLEHYPGMTEAELERVQAEAHRRFDVIDTLIIHRHGELAPGERIVLVVALSAHRQAAFEAASFLMDYLKTRAPFWKKETGADGAGEWVDAREADDAALARWGEGDKAAD